MKSGLQASYTFVRKRYYTVIPIAVSIFLLGWLIYIYVSDNPVNQIALTESYPYVLAVKPTVIEAGEDVVISLFSRSSLASLDRLEIIVISPEGQHFSVNKSATSDDRLTLTFPTDFEQASTSSVGSYAIYVTSYDESDANLPIGHFRIATLAPISSFSSFVFGSALSITLPLILSALIAVFGAVSKVRDDYVRRTQDKSRWTLDNVEIFMKMTKDAIAVCDLFEYDDNGELRMIDGKLSPDYSAGSAKPKDTFYFTLLFYRHYLEFLKKPSVFYFDDLRAELFLSNLRDRIIDQINEMLKGGTKFSEVSPINEVERISDLEKPYVVPYITAAYVWLSKRSEEGGYPNAEIFYKDLLVFYWTLFIEVNRALTVTYSSPREMKRNLMRDISNHRHLVETHIQILNVQLGLEHKKMPFKLLNY